MLNDLYPCPFCGGSGAMLELQNPEDPCTYAVQCTRCRATGAELFSSDFSSTQIFDPTQSELPYTQKFRLL